MYKGKTPYPQFTRLVNQYEAQEGAARAAQLVALTNGTVKKSLFRSYDAKLIQQRFNNMDNVFCFVFGGLWAYADYPTDSLILSKTAIRTAMRELIYPDVKDLHRIRVEQRYPISVDFNAVEAYNSDDDPATPLTQLRKVVYNVIKAEAVEAEAVRSESVAVGGPVPSPSHPHSSNEMFFDAATAKEKFYTSLTAKQLLLWQLLHNPELPVGGKRMGYTVVQHPDLPSGASARKDLYNALLLKLARASDRLDSFAADSSVTAHLTAAVRHASNRAEVQKRLRRSSV